LPPRRCQPFNRMRHKRLSAAVLPVAPVALSGPLASVLPLILTEVSPPAERARRPLFEALLHQYHYLSYRSPVGENLQYLAVDPQGRPP